MKELVFLEIDSFFGHNIELCVMDRDANCLCSQASLLLIVLITKQLTVLANTVLSWNKIEIRDAIVGEFGWF